LDLDHSNSFDLDQHDMIKTPSVGNEIEDFQIPLTQTQDRDNESLAFLSYAKSLMDQARSDYVYLFDIVRETDKVYKN
jgi:hypothetical protein